MVIAFLAGMVAGMAQPIPTVTHPNSLTASGSNNPLVWDAVVKQVKTAAMNQNAELKFWVTNTSRGDASIHLTESSCDCTVAKLPAQPWVLKPGESGALGVKMNLLGRHGRVTKSILISTSHGMQTLTVHADVPLTPAPFNVSARKQDLMAAQKDRQAVFHGSCAACHALPAKGRMGESLFGKACAICHVSEHRAEMVPDLARVAHPDTPEYWQNIIKFGRAGSLMPAFAAAEGGILTPEQIDSLVTYLVSKYPSMPANGSSNTNLATSTYTGAPR